jgi:ankyrin repeat protein
MKIQIKTLTKTSTWIFTLLLLVFTLGCSDSSDTENQNSQTNKETSNIESVSKKPKPPEIDIHAAVVSNNIEAIKQHVLAGTDLNLKDPFGGSSPIISAGLFGKIEIVKILVDAGADVNFINNDGSTALHTAAFFCRPEIVQILLDNGIDKTVRNNMGSTAYESVAGAFKDVKPFYDMLGQSLAPYGLELDDDYLQMIRPIIAEMLK